MKVQYQLQEDCLLLETSLKFYCQVNGKDLMAKIRGVVNHPIYFVYRIQFSDGYEDDFYLLENGFVDSEKGESSKPYAYALRYDLQSLGWMPGNKGVYTMRWMIGGTHTNIWIKETDSDGEHIYSIYFNGNYRFEMKKDGTGWFWRTRRVVEPEEINEKLAVEIGRLLDRELQY